MRDPNPTVVLIPGIGMFSFGKNTDSKALESLESLAASTRFT